MKRFFEIEPVDPAQTRPWRLVIDVQGDRTLFNLYWGDKPSPTHQFVVNSKDWKEIKSE